MKSGERPAVGTGLEVELGVPESTFALPSSVVRLTEPPGDKVHGFAVTWIRAGAEELDRLELLLAAHR